VKRFSAILLLSVTLLSQTELHQLLKLPVLVQHFIEHRAENKDISVTGFIILHYFSGNTKDKDYERDMQLPFKTTDCTASVAFAIIPPQPVSILQPVVVINTWYPAINNNCNHYSRTSDIWQPPKFS
jgi:hypothetical protein